MNSIERFIRRTQRSGVTAKDKYVSEGIRNFRKTLQENPTARMVQATIPDEVSVTESTRYMLALITDIALNDQSALDEKYIHVDVEEDFDIGCYVRWQDKNWLAVYEESNGFETHKTFVLKRCNQIFRFKQGDTIFDIPVCATNLTLYSDGLADGVYLSRADAKRNIKFGSNPITKSIDIGHRVMLTNKTVFKITHIDNFSQVGVMACIIGQIALIPEDDTENNVAWNPVFKDEDDNDSSKPPVEIDGIQGVENIFLGSDEEYYTSLNEVRWKILENTDAVQIVYAQNGVCKISSSSNSKYIGQSVTLIASDAVKEIARKTITIKGYF